MIYCQNKNCDLNSNCSRFSETPQLSIKMFWPYFTINKATDEDILNCEGFVEREKSVIVKQSKLNYEL